MSQENPVLADGATYPAFYRDEYGEEQTVIENDGQTLRMVVRGVEFISKPFGSFENFMPDLEGAEALSSFKVDEYGSLIEAALQFEMPITVVAGLEVIPAILSAAIDLAGAGTRDENNQDWTDTQMALVYREQSYVSQGGWGSFEMELLQIQRLLPANTYMKCCFNCAFSGYSPYGNGLWGMYCHRNHKEEYLEANDKPSWIQLNNASIEQVQEIYLCPEFQRWNGQTGYRDGMSVNRFTVTEDRAGSVSPTEKI